MDRYQIQIGVEPPQEELTESPYENGGLHEDFSEDVTIDVIDGNRYKGNVTLAEATNTKGCVMYKVTASFFEPSGRFLGDFLYRTISISKNKKTYLMAATDADAYVHSSGVRVIRLHGTISISNIGI